MRVRVLVSAGALVGLGAFAATGLGGTGEKDADLRTGPPVIKEVKRVNGAEARAAGAVTAHRRHRFRVQYFVARQPTSVPANGVTPITVLACPRRWAAISGYFRTDRGVVADHFFKARPIRRWQFGFVDLAGVPGQAVEGIVCARIR
jgi:hypothetical protein